MKVMGFVFMIKFRLNMMKFSSATAISIFSIAAVVCLREEYSFPAVKVFLHLPNNTLILYIALTYTYHEVKGGPVCCQFSRLVAR